MYSNLALICLEVVVREARVVPCYMLFLGGFWSLQYCLIYM